MRVIALSAHVCLCACLSNSALAQSNFRLERISTKEGLSQTDVRGMLQDTLGFLWIGTRDGLNKYDGQTFRKYFNNKSDSTSISFSQISGLTEGNGGNIWITSPEGVSYYNVSAGRFENYPYPQPEKQTSIVNSLFVLNDSTVILSTSIGLTSFNKTSGEFEKSRGFSEFNSFNVKQFHTSNKYGTWVATDRGLYRRQPALGQYELLLKGVAINHILFDDLIIFLSTENGLYMHSLVDSTTSKISLPAGTGEVKQSIRTEAGELWVACGKVVVLGEDDSTIVKMFSFERDNPSSLSENTSQTLYETNDGVVWVGTLGYGLNKYNPDLSRFSYLGEAGNLKLSANYITSIFTTDDQTLYVGTYRGLNVVDLKKRKVKYLLEGSLIHDVKGDADGTIWVSSSNGFFQMANSKLSRIDFPWEMYDMADWGADTLLLATNYNGLFFLNKKTLKYSLFLPKDSLPGIVLSALPEREKLWVGGDKGLSYFSRAGKLLQHFKSGQNAKDLPSDVVKHLFADKSKNLWVGTWGGGLGKLSLTDSTFTVFDQSNGLPSNVVYGIIPDDDGHLWMSTNMGISALNPVTNELRSFDYADGLQGNEFNTGAFFRSADGVIYFGGTEGLTFFDPKSLLSNDSAPEIILTELLINDASVQAQSVSFASQVETSWNKNNILVEFTSIDFKTPEKLTYQYSVNDSVWYNIGNRRNIELLNLASGNHYLTIRAKSPSSDWSLRPFTLKIKITPPFWQERIFIAAVVLAFISMGFAAYRIRIRLLKRANLVLNRTVEERTQEILLKNEEIVQQNDQLTKKSAELKQNYILLEQQRNLLKDFAAELEEKVRQRTADIERLNQDLEQKYLQLEQFSFIAAHNFRGPIARIKGLIELCLMENADPKEQLTFLRHLKSSADNLDEVITDMNAILTLKKNLQGVHEIVRLKPLLQQTQQLLENEIDEKGMAVDSKSFEAHSIRGSLPYSQSIFLNLIENAIKYSNPESKPCLKISCFKAEGMVNVTFEDNGIGIDMTLAKDKVFRPYQRFTLNSSGKGLGLYMVKTQIELMGGSITVSSIPMEGTTFVLTFPEADMTHLRVKEA